MCSHKWRVMYELGPVYLMMSKHSLHEGKCLPYVFVQGSLRPVADVAHLFFLRVTYSVGIFCIRNGKNQTHGGRHTVELFACFGIRACLLSFWAKS